VRLFQVEREFSALGVAPVKWAFGMMAQGEKPQKMKQLIQRLATRVAFRNRSVAVDLPLRKGEKVPSGYSTAPSVTWPKLIQSHC
jgi:hypothetical protein